MYKTLLTSLVLAVSGAAYAGSDFQSLDTNGDGYISAEEASSDSKLTNMWSAVDTNGDGQLDSAEFSAFEAIDEGGDSSSMPEDSSD